MRQCVFRIICTVQTQTSQHDDLPMAFFSLLIFYTLSTDSVQETDKAIAQPDQACTVCICPEDHNAAHSFSCHLTSNTFRFIWSQLLFICNPMSKTQLFRRHIKICTSSVYTMVSRFKSAISPGFMLAGIQYKYINQLSTYLLFRFADDNTWNLASKDIEDYIKTLEN